MSGGNFFILLILVIAIAKLFYELGKFVGRFERRNPHDLYQKAALEMDHRRRVTMIHEANDLAFPNQSFTKAFKTATKE